jgi:hypothetical protein
MSDIPLAEAMLLWNSGFNGATPAFAVRPLGHDDYYRYGSQVGACFTDWRKMDDQRRRLQLMIDAWHIVAFYEVPIELVRDGLMVIPEYRNMLASDCLPKQFRHEREN